MADLILVNADSRCLQALYGLPPAGVVPTCTPKRGEQTTDEWYAEQEARYGLYAAQKARRPKRSWWGGQKEESAEQEESAQEARQSPDRQPQRLSVQQQLRQQRQNTDTSEVSETRAEEGIYWFTIKSEEVDA